MAGDATAGDATGETGAPGSPARRAVVAEPVRAPAAAAASFFSDLRYIGQLDRTYLVCEAPGELVLVDQHAAHERVEFQRLRARCADRTLPTQRLLFPHRLELSPAEQAVIADCAEQLAAVGLELEAGDDAIAIKAVPAGLRAAKPEAVVRELVADLAERGASRAVEERLDLVLATIACHSVVRAGDSLTPREAEALLRSMDGVEYKAHCPHGRPVLLRLGVDEIARRFGR
jgi:DNA mismatch repair protein MutL